MNYKQMEKEVAAMKRSLQKPPLRGLIGMPLTEAERGGMGPEARIVEDYYSGVDGEERIVVDRITADFADEGKDFPDGTWDREYWDANPPQIDRIAVRKKRRVLPGSDR
jgi:hypothetical protein